MGFFNFFFPLFPGTTRAVNEWNDGFCAAVPGAIPFLSLHPSDSAEEHRELVDDFLLRRRFGGLKVHSYAQDFPLSHDSLPEVCAVLAREHRLLFVHTGYARFYGSRYDETAMAADLAALMTAFPDLPVVAAHMFYPRLDIAVDLLDRFPNLYADVTNTLFSLQEDGRLNDWLPVLNRYAGRILFGSDYGLAHTPPQAGIALLETLPLTEESRRLIGGETARRLVATLGLSRFPT